MIETKLVDNKVLMVHPKEKRDYHINFPEADVKILGEIFERTTHSSLDWTPEDFVINLDLRLYTEWCLENIFKRNTDPSYTPKSHHNYNGEGFLDFIRDETHYEIERRGLIWQHIGEEDYNYIKYQVLTGLVKKAVSLFSEWSGKSEPKDPQDKSNIRGDLRDFIYSNESRAAA